VATNRLSDLLPETAIRLHVPAADWRAAVRASGDALIAGGATTEAYSDEMIATVEQLGPYIVIAPGIALAHSRPSPAVLRPGLSIVTLAEPVPFGNQANDPVRLVVGLRATPATCGTSSLDTRAARTPQLDHEGEGSELERRDYPRVRILAVCGMGLGSGLLLRMQAEKALRQLGVTADLEVADIGSARAMAQTVDLIITSNELAEHLGTVKPKVVTITNFIDLNEMVRKLEEALKAP
jgi:PTS system ascorbate-specific IIA component